MIKNATALRDTSNAHGTTIPIVSQYIYPITDIKSAIHINCLLF